MNVAHLHLILNHIPLIGVGFVTLLMVIALIRKSGELITVSLLLAVVVALSAIPVYLTGEPAEETVEDMQGVSEQIIDKHEEAAETAFIFLEVVGGIALITLIGGRFNKKFGNALTIITLAGLIAGGGLVAWTANLGGKIHHPEVRGDKMAMTLPSGNTGGDKDD